MAMVQILNPQGQCGDPLSQDILNALFPPIGQMGFEHSNHILNGITFSVYLKGRVLHINALVHHHSPPLINDVRIKARGDESQEQKLHSLSGDSNKNQKTHIR